MIIQRVLPSLFAGLAISTLAAAQETQFAVSAGVAYTDNIERVSTDKQSEYIPQAGLQLGITREGRLEMDLSADMQYRGYSDNTYDDELVGGLNGRLSYAFVPDRFEWMVENNLGQSFIDPRDVETPDNRQNLNYFTTGPTFMMTLGSRTNLSLSGRWSDVDYEDSELDSQRLVGALQLSRALSDTSSLALDVSAQRVEFDQSPPNSDYDLQTLSAVYRIQGARTTLALTGGVTSLHDMGETSDGPLADLTLTRELGARSTLTLNAGTRFYDAADSFRRERGFEDIVLGNEDVVPAQDAFQQDYAFVRWDLAGNRTTLQLSADWSKDDREVESDLNRKAYGADLVLTRRMGPRTTATLFGRFAHEDYDSGSDEFDEWTAGAGLDWDLSDNIAIGIRAERFEGSGDTSAGPDTRDYDENRFTVTFTYSPGS